MKPELQQQLDNLKTLGITEQHPEYIKLKNFLEKVSEYPRNDWNTVSEQINDGTLEPPSLLQKVLVKIGK